MTDQMKEHFFYWYKTANRRARTNLVLFIVGILILGVFSAINIDSDDTKLKVLLVSSTLACIINLVVLIKTRNINVSNIASSMIIFVLSLTLLTLGGKSATGFLWTYPLCAIAIFTLNFRMGVFYCATYLGFATAIFFMGYQSEYVVSYDPVLFSRYIASCITLFIACLAAVYVQERSFDTIKKINRKLEQSAYTDSLTKLHNRRYFKQLLTKDAYFSSETAENGCVLLLDVDHFKPINDELGHDAGDEALKMIAATIKNKLRGDDLVVRWGGEEFLAILQNSSMEIATTRANEIRLSIENNQALSGLVGRKVTISIGVAEITSTDSAKEIIKTADERLYQAKESGRNKVVSAPLS